MSNSIVLNFTQLPEEILYQIFSVVKSPVDLMSLTAVSQIFRAIADEPKVWHQMANDLYIVLNDGQNAKQEVIKFIRQCNQVAKNVFKIDSKNKNLVAYYHLVLSEAKPNAQLLLERYLNQYVYPLNMAYVHLLVEAGATLPTTFNLMKNIPNEDENLIEGAHVHPLYLQRGRYKYCQVGYSTHKKNIVFPLYPSLKVQPDHILIKSSSAQNFTDLLKIVTVELLPSTIYKTYELAKKITLNVLFYGNDKDIDLEEEIKNAFLKKFDKQLLNLNYPLDIKLQDKVRDIVVRKLKTESGVASVAALEKEAAPIIKIKWEQVVFIHTAE